MSKKIKVIVTGTTGMVGEGVLHECLQHPLVEEVLSVSRRHIEIRHPKLKTLVVSDFSQVRESTPDIRGYDACYFCLGVSSIGMKEPEYTKFTYDLTIDFARAFQKHNPEATFCYVSGSGTDSTGQGRSMWARVKGRTENELMRLFPNAFMFRPGFMRPTKGLTHALKFYKYINWMYPAMRLVFPSFVSTLAELGEAMINVTLHGFPKKVLEVKDIVAAARR